MNNEIAFNNLHGIEIEDSNVGTISFNLILENEKYGVTINSISSNIIIHHNSFINNNPSKTEKQALDHGNGNYWYDPDTLEGNYWSDRGRRNKYLIDGDANSVDLYPLKNPTVLPDDNYPLKTNHSSIPSIFSLFILVIIAKKKRNNHKMHKTS